MNPFVAQTLAEVRVLELYRAEALLRRQRLYAAAQRLFVVRPGLRVHPRG